MSSSLYKFFTILFTISFFTQVTFAETGNKKSNGSNAFSKNAPKEAKWETYAYNEKHFSVDLPAKPDHIRQKIDVPKSDLVIEYDTYVSEPSDEVVYVISVWDYPSEIDMSNPESNLKDGFNGMLSALPGSKVIISEAIDNQGFKALEFLVKNDDVYFQGRLLIAYNTLYQIFTVYRESQNMKESYKKFINSFKITNPEELKADQHKSAGKSNRLNV